MRKEVIAPVFVIVALGGIAAFIGIRMSRDGSGSAFLPAFRSAGASSHARNDSSSGGLKPTLSASELAHKRLQYWERHLERDPFSLTAKQQIASHHLTIARLTGDDSHYRVAESILERALPRTPASDPTTKILLAQTVMARHDFAGALSYSEELLKLFPNDVSVLAVHGDAALGRGEYERAFADFEKLLQQTERGKRSFAALVRGGEMRELQGRSDEAMALFTEARESARGIAEETVSWLLYRIGQNRLAVGDLEAAENAFTEARRLTPDYKVPIAGLAEVATLGADRVRARERLQNAVQEDPTPKLFQRLSEIAVLDGDRKRANEYSAEALRRAELRSADGTGGHLRELADVLLARGDALPRAIELVERDLALRPGEIHSLGVAARAYRMTGDLARAEAKITESLRLGTRDAELLLEASAIAGAQGNSDRSDALLAEARSVNAPYVAYRLAVRDALAAQRASSPRTDS